MVEGNMVEGGVWWRGKYSRGGEWKQGKMAHEYYMPYRNLLLHMLTSRKKIKNFGIMKNNYARKNTEVQSFHSVGVPCIA